MGLLVVVSIKDKPAANAEFVILGQALLCSDLTKTKCYLLHHVSLNVVEKRIHKKVVTVELSCELRKVLKRASDKFFEDVFFLSTASGSVFHQ